MDSIREQLADFCGAERFAAFSKGLRVGHDPRPRLLYWQEQLIREFATATGAVISTNVGDVIALFCASSVECSLVSPPSVPPLPLDGSYVRQFQWASPAASITHLTDFVLRIEANVDESRTVVADEAGPHQRPDVVPLLLDQIAAGVVDFQELHEDVSMTGIRISLLRFKDHAIDLQPRKYRLAAVLLLRDLLIELRAGLHLRHKLIGMPI